MDVLRSHFRPEFINRIDEIIVFHSLNEQEIRKIVELQLERVVRTVRGQDVQLSYDTSVLDHFGSVGYQPEFGARELRRLIRSELETELARSMLGGAIEDGDCIRALWSDDEQKIMFEKVEKPMEENNDKEETTLPPPPSEAETTDGASNTDRPDDQHRKTAAE